MRGKVSCYVCTTPMVPTIRCRALELIAGIVLDSAHEARDSDETTLVGQVAGSRAEASGYQGGGEGSVLLDTAAVGVTAPAEQMAPAIGREEAPMAHGAPAARADELDAEQSVPPCSRRSACGARCAMARARLTGSSMPRSASRSIPGSAFRPI